MRLLSFPGIACLRFVDQRPLLGVQPELFWILQMFYAYQISRLQNAIWKNIQCQTAKAETRILQCTNCVSSLSMLTFWYIWHYKSVCCHDQPRVFSSQVAIHVTRSTACAMMGESLLRQNCSHGSCCLKSNSAASKSVIDWASGGHLWYAVHRSTTSFRATSRASGSLSFNCAAASWMSSSIPYCLIPSTPWENIINIWIFAAR